MKRLEEFSFEELVDWATTHIQVETTKGGASGMRHAVRLALLSSISWQSASGTVRMEQKPMKNKARQNDGNHI